MTVKELYDELGKEVRTGHGDLKVIANCEFTISDPYDGSKCDEHYDNFYLTELNDVYYQSGDIELGFSQGGIN